MTEDEFKALEAVVPHEPPKPVYGQRERRCEKRCETCAHWRAAGTYEGQCRAGLPQAQPIGRFGASSSPWPVTRNDDDCAHWLDREK